MESPNRWPNTNPRSAACPFQRRPLARPLQHRLVYPATGPSSPPSSHPIRPLFLPLSLPYQIGRPLRSLTDLRDVAAQELWRPSDLVTGARVHRQGGAQRSVELSARVAPVVDGGCFTQARRRWSQDARSTGRTSSQAEEKRGSRRAWRPM